MAGDKRVYLLVPADIDRTNDVFHVNFFHETSDYMTTNRIFRESHNTITHAPMIVDS